MYNSGLSFLKTQRRKRTHEGREIKGRKMITKERKRNAPAAKVKSCGGG